MIDENTAATTILANFASTTDTATFFLTGDDAAAFTIDPNTGALTFKTAPDYEIPTDGDTNNFYRVTIEADDGTTTKTQNLLVVVKDVKGNADTTPAQSTGATAAEAVPNTDGEATPEATKPSIGRRILDYLFGSQEEHRQMQNQQMDNMFGDSDLDPINPQDPDIL